MYNTSQAYKDAVYGVSRRTVGRVTFDITDVSAYTDVLSITTNSAIASAALNVTAQVVDRVRSQTYKGITSEQNRVKLDGSFTFGDDVNVNNNGERGYVSGAICDGAGVFSTPPTLTITFNGVHSSAGLTVTFDYLGGEYAADYDISAYDASNALITTVAVTGNTDVIDQPLGQLLNYKKIVLTIRKWGRGSRRARVTEVDFGIVKVYTGDNLTRLGLVEEVDLATATVPSAEFSFTVDNTDRVFNILNPTGFYKYLQQRQKITPEIGVELTPGGAVEYAPMGLYYLDEWVSDEGTITASFTARTALDLMSSYDYVQLTSNSKTLDALAIQLFTICGITNYVLDPELGGITTNAMSNKINCRDALQMVAIAGYCNITVSRSGAITLKQNLNVSAPVDEITNDNTYREPQITLEKVTKSVSVSYFTSLAAAAGTVTATDSSVTDGTALEVKNNTFINNAALAGDVANWILSMRSNRARYAINWRGNPAHEMGDSVAIDNSFGIPQNALLTKNTITYNGALRVQTEARGVPN